MIGLKLSDDASKNFFNTDYIEICNENSACFFTPLCNRLPCAMYVLKSKKACYRPRDKWG